MCYPKPGPRCSSHAKTALLKAKIAIQEALTDGNTEAMMQAREAAEKARDDFDATPLGQKYLERRILQGMDHQGKYSLRKELGAARRADQLAQLKATDIGDPEHVRNADEGNEAYVQMLPNEFSEGELYDWSLENPTEKRAKIAQMIEESDSWISKLSADEAEAAAWFTSDGSSALNAYYSTGEIPERYREKYSEDFVTQRATDLRSALSKYESTAPIITYRGLNDHQFESVTKGLTYDEAREAVFAHVDATFQPGMTWTPHASMSTSLNPGKAYSFTDSGAPVLLEIKTKHAAPVCNVSAWDASEQEAITHPDASYRVVSVRKDAKILRRTSGNKDSLDDVWVVQLEEI